MTDDQVSAIRAELEQAQALGEGPIRQEILWGCTGRLSCDSPVHYHGCFADTQAYCTDPDEHPNEAAGNAAYRSLTPKLAGAMLAVLDRHHAIPSSPPVRRRNGQLLELCAHCVDVEPGGYVRWPCPTVKPILVAWGGQDDG